MTGFIWLLVIIMWGDPGKYVEYLQPTEYSTQNECMEAAREIKLTYKGPNRADFICVAKPKSE